MSPYKYPSAGPEPRPRIGFLMRVFFLPRQDAKSGEMWYNRWHNCQGGYHASGY